MTDPIRLLVTIVEHGKGERITNLANAQHIHFNLLLHGRGTASSDILDMLGLGSTEKDVVVCALPRSSVKQMLHSVAEEMRLKRPGTGVAFSLPLSGINELIARIILDERKQQDQGSAQEEAADMGAEKHWLVLAVVNPGITDQVMAVAKEAGATGGTILHARGVGRENAEAFLGVSIQSEREIVAILCPRAKGPAIMQAVNASFGPKSGAKGIIFSLPVRDMMGIGVTAEESKP
ncbi:MAG TPA: hypothetical protein IAA84_04005 [Candidatus Alectryocaccomicrobium excrementavium]|uniref:Uncharacterized protein n=1 Tax=Candidatus Alectryocaccomicrobium excrementavium TaxID=2840668 RepID=A0A9D1FZ58_9FIRM|nr:hypothetical protein [Candidatus Alectryocaccomicrobium excrementavium]